MPIAESVLDRRHAVRGGSVRQQTPPVGVADAIVILHGRLHAIVHAHEATLGRQPDRLEPGLRRVRLAARRHQHSLGVEALAVTQLRGRA